MFYDFLEYTFDLIPEPIDPISDQYDLDHTSAPEGNGLPVIAVPDMFEPPLLLSAIEESYSPEMLIDLLAPFDSNYLNIFLDPLGHSFIAYPYEFDWNPANFNGIGNPLNDSENWNLQTSPNSCAVMAQINIYESLTGYQLPEEIVCRIAEDIGWYDEQTGTPVIYTGNILQALGIPVEKSFDCSLGDIAGALSNGDKVMVCLDASEIWNPYRELTTGLPLEQNDSGHAVWVTGLDIESNGSVKVILNDSGLGEGKMMAVDGADFLNAWEDSGCFMAVAKTAPLAMI